MTPHINIDILPLVKKKETVDPSEQKTTFEDKLNCPKGENLSECEERMDGSIDSANPWNVLDADVFLKYCCPECDFKANELDFFSQHAVINHELSNILFSDESSIDNQRILIEDSKNAHVKDEPIEDYKDYNGIDLNADGHGANVDDFDEHNETTEFEPDIEIDNENQGSKSEENGKKVERVKEWRNVEKFCLHLQKSPTDVSILQLFC